MLNVLTSCSYINLLISPVIIKEPYQTLFQYRNEIREYAASEERNVCRKGAFGELV